MSELVTFSLAVCLVLPPKLPMLMLMAEAGRLCCLGEELTPAKISP